MSDPSRSADPGTGREEDLLFGKLLIDRGYVTPEQVKECLKIRATQPRDSRGRPLRLGDILMRRGYVSMEALEAVIRERTSRLGATPPTQATKAGNFGEMAAPPPDVAKFASDPKRRLGKYILVKEVGRGGMGAVYRAWDSALNRYVAVKVLTGDRSPDDIQRFLREAQMGGSLTHPNIAAIYDMGEDQDKPYLVMQFIDGKPASDIHMSTERAAEVIRVAALALHAAHQKGVVHRDIKPANLMVDVKGEVFVTDFGIARQRNQSNLTRTGVALGTPSFMSPEQAASKEPTPRSDVYSLGATLYDLVTGRPPFVASTPLQTVMQVINKEPTPPSRISRTCPRPLELIILKCLEKDPAARYATARELAEDLDRFLKGEQVAAQPPTFWTLLRRRARRIRTMVPITIALLTGLVTLVVVVLGSLSRAEKFSQAARRGDTLFEAGRFGDALEAYNQALAFDSAHPGVRQRVDACRTKLKEAEDLAKREGEEAERRRQNLLAAAPEVQKAKEILEQSERDLYRPGADLEASRRSAGRALEHLEKALRLVPDHSEALYVRGRVKQFLLDAPGAEEDYSRAILAAKDNALALAARGRLRLRQIEELQQDMGGGHGQTAARNEQMAAMREMAAADFNAAVKAGQEDLRPLFEAYVLFVGGFHEQAGEACAKLADRMPTNEELFKLWGDTLYYRANPDTYGRVHPAAMPLFQQALEAYGKAISLRTNYADARAMRGHMLMMAGRREEALEDLEWAVRVDGRGFLGLILLAKGLSGEGAGRADTDRAVALYGRAIEVRPDTYMARVNRASVYGRTGRPEEALRDLDEACRLMPDHYFAWFLKGSVLGNMDRLEEAEQLLTKSIEMFAHAPASWYSRGAVRHRMGRWTAAREDFEEALRRGHPDRDRLLSIIEQLKSR